MLLSRNSNSSGLEYYKLLKQAGWQAIDINETCDNNVFLTDENAQISFVKNVLDNIHQAGLIVSQCHAPMAGCYKDASEEKIETTITSIVNCVKVADKLSIPFVVVHPFIYSWSEKDPDLDKTFKLNLEYLKRACENAKNTIVCLENMPGSNGFILNGNDIKRMIDAVDNNLHACIDTGHAASLGIKMSDFTNALGNKIKTLHVHDSFVGSDRHMLPYQGAVDWADFKEAIKNLDVDLNSESGFSNRLPKENLLEWETFERKVFETLLP